MNRITHTLLVCFVLILVSCSSNNKRKSTPEQGDDFVANNVTNTTSSSVYVKSKAIDFFGVQLQGKYNDIVVRIYALPMLSLIERRDTMKNEHNNVISFSHTVKFCDVPCGMNVSCQVNYDDEMSVHDLCFITSQTDDETIHKFVSELTKYYGEPSISDDKEDSFYWYLSSGL